MTHSTLFIRNLVLSVNLGWRSQERKLEQAVFLDMKIQFPLTPKACESDHLKDTVCYATLIECIRSTIANKNYKLVEHLSRDIYTVAKTKLPEKTELNVRVTKFPKIEGLKNGVCFDYGDDKSSW